VTSTSAPGRSAPSLAPKVRAALLRYRVMAYVTGTLLVVLTVAVVVKYTAGGDLANDVTTVVGIAHGWLFIIYLIAVLDLAIRARLNWWRVVVVGLCGTIPVLTFVAERSTAHAVVAGRH
jgi:integral membrane protein